MGNTARQELPRERPDGLCRGGASRGADRGAAVPRTASGLRWAPARRDAVPDPSQQRLPMASAALGMLLLTCVLLLLGRAFPAAGKRPPVCADIAAGELAMGGWSGGAKARKVLYLWEGDGSLTQAC